MRCSWCGSDPLYVKYHDEEWGAPIRNDDQIFEFLCLEAFQAGLSWITILRKRENFRKAFDNFDCQKIANYDEDKIKRLMQDNGIIRNRLKINATVNNAQRFLEVQREFGSFSKFIWTYVDHTPIQNNFETTDQIPAKTPLSEKISSDLKKRGFKFLGPTVIYAHMQASGMVNDHVTSCYRHQQLLTSFQP